MSENVWLRTVQNTKDKKRPIKIHVTTFLLMRAHCRLTFWPCFSALENWGPLRGDQHNLVGKHVYPIDKGYVSWLGDLLPSLWGSRNLLLELHDQLFVAGQQVPPGCLERRTKRRQKITSWSGGGERGGRRRGSKGFWIKPPWPGEAEWVGSEGHTVVEMFLCCNVLKKWKIHVEKYNAHILKKNRLHCSHRSVRQVQ